MYLDDVTSKEEAQQALDAGDTQLRDDIIYKLTASARAFNVSADWEPESYDKDDVLRSNAESIREGLRHHSRVDIRLVPDDAIDDAVIEHDDKFICHHGMYARGYTSLCSYLTTNSAIIMLPDGWEKIPDSMAHYFYENVKYIEEWSQGTDTLSDDNVAYQTDDDGSIYIEGGADEIAEFCQDIKNEYARGLVRSDPVTAIGKMLDSPTLSDDAKSLLKTRLTKEELSDLAFMFISGGADDEGNNFDSVVAEYLEALGDGSAQSGRKTIAEISKEDVAPYSGTMKEEAPWTVVELKPSDLGLESTRMSHCVGQKGMGYVRQVRDGSTLIWSVRDRNGKPRFTIEVDPQRHTINQVKGKANRLPGFTGAHGSGEFKFPSEVPILSKMLQGLGFDPNQIGDMRPGIAAYAAAKENGVHARVVRALRAAISSLQ